MSEKVSSLRHSALKAQLKSFRLVGPVRK